MDLPPLSNPPPGLPRLPQRIAKLRWLHDRLNEFTYALTASKTSLELNTIADFFIHEKIVSISKLAELFSNSEIKYLRETGVVSEIIPNELKANFSICTWNSFSIWSDRWPHRNPSWKLAVYKPGFDSVFLLQTLPRRRCEDFLDLCTGTGIQAFYAAIHSQNVLGIDINPRCVQMARMNAEFNGIKNVQFRVSSIFNGLSHCRRFDILVANTPFIPKKMDDLPLFSDGGKDGGDHGRAILENLKNLLKRNGYFQILTTAWALPFLRNTWRFKKYWDLFCISSNDSNDMLLVCGKPGCGRLNILNPCGLNPQKSSFSQTMEYLCRSIRRFQFNG
ncbi:MAG TPA: class I SAM-dependent methyltransferase [Elusimicrobiota bacterium]|nr:class I SAM-dependent methyltransferase [Elusimicrobiota bacterium]